MPHPPPSHPALHSDRAPPLPPEPAEAQIVPSAPRPRPHGFRRAIGLMASLVGTAITFAAALAGGTVLHVGVAPARRIASAAVNQILDSTFRGKIVITHLGALGPNRVDGANAMLTTHEGAPILQASGVHARIALGPLVWSLVKGGALKIHITEISIDHVDALLQQGDDGQLTVATAFQPGTEGPPPPPTKPSSGVDLALPRITLGSAWVHGSLGSALPIDASLAHVTAAFALTPTTMSASGAFTGEARDLAKDAPVALAVDGKLASNVADAHVQVGTGEAAVDVRAHARLSSDDNPTMDANVTVAARDVDAAAFGGPASRLGMDTTASAHIADGGAITGTYHVHVLPGAVASQATPDARIGGSFTKLRVLGSAHVSETGLPLDLRYDVSLAAADGPDVGFDLTTRARDLKKIAQLGGGMAGRALVQAQGHALLGAKTVDARVETQIDDFVMGSIAVNHVTADAVVKGAFTAPQSGLLVTGSGLRVGSMAFPTVAASAYGPLDDIRLDAKVTGERGRLITAQANVDAAAGVQVRALAVTLAQGKDTVTAKVAKLESRGGRLDVDGIKVEGAGQPLTAEVHMRPGSMSARANSGGLDLGTVARFVEGPTTKQGGCVALDVDLTASKSSTEGHVNLDASGVTDGKFVQSVSAKIAATFRGREVDAKIDASDVEMGHVTVTTEGAKLGGGALDARAWMNATGKAHAELDVDLARATQASPIDLPIQDASGRVVAKVDLARDDARKRPTLGADITTEKLTFSTLPGTVPNTDGTVTVVKPPFHSQDLDAHVMASVNGATGESKLDAQLHDKVGPLLTLNAGATLPLKSLFAGDAQEALLATAVTFHAEVPPRSLDALPPMLGTLPIRGQVGLTLDAKGDARDPHLTGELMAKNIFDADDPTPIPISLDTKFSYDGKQAIVTLAAVRPEGEVLNGAAVMKIAMADLLGGVSPPPWEASAKLTLHEMPIGALADFANQEIDGNVSGTIALHDLHKAGSLSVKLALDKLVLSGAKFPSATAALDVTNGALAAHARIEQPDGFADVSASGAMKWGAEVAPSPDESKPVEVKLSAKNFRAIAFAPFLQGTLDELDGILNANAEIHIKPGFKDGKMDGAILVDKGVVEAAAVGEEFHDLKARISMKPWGQWNVQELSGRATSGKFTATAQAKVQGFHLQSAEAHLKIAEREKLPVTIQGTALGRAWGQVDAKAAMSADGKKLDVDVTIPNFHVDLEDATGHAVESTDPDATLVVGMHDKHGKMERLAYDGTQPVKPPTPKTPPPSNNPPMVIHLVTHLGPDLEVKRGTMLKLYVSDGPTIDVGATTKISGSIHVPRGYIELQGKRFEVDDTSTVTFNGQPPDNPLVQAQATYDSPDGTKVIAKFVGPVKTGKLTLTSDPKLSDSEILSLLMFGSSDGTFGQSAPVGQQGNDTTQAASVAGGVVTEGLNKAISGVSGVEVQTAVDTQETGNPRPEVEVALSRKVSATVLYSLGVPPPGDNPDDTLLLVDWRFHKNYSTEATLGDKGTTILDLAWKYRY